MDFLNGLENAMQWLMVIAALVALAVGIYVLRTVGSLLVPLGKGFQWLFGKDVAAGAAHGARILIWAVILAAVLWFCMGGRDGG